MSQPVFQESDRAGLQARLLLIARQPRDPQAARAAVLREILTWVKQNAPAPLSHPQIEELVHAEYRMHEALLQERRTDKPAPALQSAGSVIRKSKASKDLVPTRFQEQLLDAAVRIHEQPGQIHDAAWMAKQLIQATLPHSNPRGNPSRWSRNLGNVNLSIKPGSYTDPATNAEKSFGYPYGSIPRLILYWLTTELVRTKDRRLRENDRRVPLGDSMADFMRDIGLNPANGSGRRSDAKRLREQLLRLFRAKISFEQKHEQGGLRGLRWLDMDIAPEGEFWWDVNRPDQASLWGSWIEVGEKFFQAVIAHPVPIDTRAIQAIKRSPLALDLYGWVVYTTFNATQKAAPCNITWKQLHAVFGGEYKNLDEFARKARAELRKIATVYPGMSVGFVQGGFVLKPGGAPAIGSRPKPAQLS